MFQIKPEHEAGMEKPKHLGGTNTRRSFACNQQIEASFIHRKGTKKPMLSHRLLQFQRRDWDSNPGDVFTPTD
jgi:hypothetical protein